MAPALAAAAPRFGGMRPVLAAGLLSTVALSLVGCSMVHEGSAETDRIAETVAVAISYPHQSSAEGFARASWATAAGQDGRLEVIGVEELEADDPTDPIARLLWRVHVAGSESGWVTSDPVTACYEAVFTRHGNVGEPSRRRCPAAATPVVPTPLVPTPEPRIPDGAGRALEAVLTALGPTVTTDQVAASLREAIPAGEPEPTTLVEVRGADVGVSLSEGPGRSCLLGARVDGRVLVWQPALVQVQPGELTCDPGTALALQGTTPPH